MKTRIVLIVLLAIYGLHAAAQGQQDTLFFAEVKKKPLFEGGDHSKFIQWVQSSVRIPDGLSGIGTIKMEIRFVVDEQGRVGGTKVNPDADPAIAGEVLRVIGSSAAWTPGKHGGRPVCVEYILPLRFETTRAEEKVEQMPMFAGGDIVEFRAWVMSQLKYPPYCAKNNITGKVIASFVINTDGALTDIVILTSPHELLGEEVTRILSSSPEWTPGEHNGKLCRVKFTIPITFSIQGGTPQNSPADVRRSHPARNPDRRY